MTERFSNFLASIYFLLIFLFFLTLGSDFPSQLYFRQCVLLLLFVLVAWNYRQDIPQILKQWPFRIFLVFVTYEVLRSIFSIWIIKINFGEIRIAQEITEKYQDGVFHWGLLLIAFVLGMFLLKDKKTALRFLKILSWSAFLLAAVSIWPLLQFHHLSYPLKTGQLTNYYFFPPILYSLNFVKEYILAVYGHVNYTGDIIAIGFFSSITILIYEIKKFLQNARKKNSSSAEILWAPTFARWILLSVMAATIFVVVLMINSRGTIIFFAFSSLLYAFFYMAKIKKLKYLLLFGVLLIFLIGFFAWAGDYERIWKELLTLEREFNSNVTNSFSYNIEGAKRAIAIYQDFGLFGTGTAGFRLFSKFYASTGFAEGGLIGFYVMCHYLQVLTEEGLGAYLYFLFLMVSLGTIFIKLIKVKSNFQFLFGLALFSSTMMFLSHASINHLMQRFSVSFLVYTLMAGSLSVLSDNFEHDTY